MSAVVLNLSGWLSTGIQNTPLPGVRQYGIINPCFSGKGYYMVKNILMGRTIRDATKPVFESGSTAVDDFSLSTKPIDSESLNLALLP
jgi:hypothetical protein